MTALQAAGGGLPLALHIPHVVEQAGSLAGFAAVIGLAVLSALYFSQARDLRRLREWAGRAPERAAEGVPAAVPGRVVAVPQRPAPAPGNNAPGQPAAANGDAAPAVVATPAGAKPGEPTPAGAVAKPDEAKAAEGEAGADRTAAEGATAGDEKPGDEAGAGDAGGTDDPDQEADAAKTGDGAPAGAPGAARPGMPAPASAAAAAGAGAASVAGPAVAGASGSGATSTPSAPAAAPAGPPRPSAQPQRPPGSVLPPRTGTLPPVRRLPASNTAGGPPGTGILGTPPDAKKKRNPVYIVLAVAGVIVLGAAAAVGVPAIVNGSKNDNKSTKSSKTARTTAKKAKAAPVQPDKITVAVLNGTAIPGLAAQVGDRIDADGFTLGTVSNASQTQGQRANSIAMYAPGHQRDAQRVARKLGITNVQPVDANSQSIAGDASVVVVVGSDKTQ